MKSGSQQPENNELNIIPTTKSKTQSLMPEQQDTLVRALEKIISEPKMTQHTPIIRGRIRLRQTILSGLRIPITIDQKQRNITKIRVITETYKLSSGSNQLILSLEDKTKLTIPLDTKNAELLAALLSHLNAFDDDLLNRNGQTAIRWNDGQMNEIYSKSTDNVDEHYEESHMRMINAIERIIESNQIKDKINIIDAGCGTGLFIKSLSEKFGVDKAHLIGFDFNKDSINDAVLVNEKSDAHFLVGDMNDFNAVFSKASAYFNENAPTFVTLSGSLTRLVLRGTFQSVKILKNLFLTEHVKYLVGCGVGEPLINKHIAKQIGFDLEIPHGNTQKLFTCRKLSMDEIVSRKLKKLTQYNTLDLSLSPIPEILLSQPTILKSLKENSIIDISFTKTSDELFRQINAIISSNPSIKVIFWHESNEEIKKVYRSIPHQNIQELATVNSEIGLALSRWCIAGLGWSLNTPAIHNLEDNAEELEIKIFQLSSSINQKTPLNVIIERAMELYQIMQNPGLEPAGKSAIDAIFKKLKSEYFDNLTANRKNGLICEAFSGSIISILSIVGNETYLKTMLLLEIINESTPPVYRFLATHIGRAVNHLNNSSLYTIGSNLPIVIEIIYDVAATKLDLETIFCIQSITETYDLNLYKENISAVASALLRDNDSTQPSPIKNLVLNNEFIPACSYYALSFLVSSTDPKRTNDLMQKINGITTEIELISLALGAYNDKHHDAYMSLINALTTHNMQSKLRDYYSSFAGNENIINLLEKHFDPRIAMTGILDKVNGVINPRDIILSYNAKENTLLVSPSFSNFDDMPPVDQFNANADVKLKQLGFSEAEISTILSNAGIGDAKKASEQVIRIQLNDEQLQSIIDNKETIIKSKPGPESGSKHYIKLALSFDDYYSSDLDSDNEDTPLSSSAFSFFQPPTQEETPSKRHQVSEDGPKK